MKTGSSVVVLLRRPLDHPRTAQGLRAAVGYLTADLRVAVVVCQSGRPPRDIVRPLSMLRALGHLVVGLDEISDTQLQTLLAAAHAIVAW
jgi:hypothetical protein